MHLPLIAPTDITPSQWRTSPAFRHIIAQDKVVLKEAPT
jgi:hypothetical protein